MPLETLSRVVVLIAASAVVGPVLTAQSVQAAAVADRSTLTTDSDLPPVAAQNGGLCGMTPTKVAGIVDHYGFQPDPGALASALSAPFDCDAYGDLCDALDPGQAHAFACGVWYDLDAQEPFQTVRAKAINRLTTWGTECTPDAEVCAEICSPISVASCSGVWFAGKCHSLAMCELQILPELALPFFDFIDPGI